MAGTDARPHIAALDEFYGIFTEKLTEGGSVTFPPRGTSMLPMLRAYGDSVTIVMPPARMKKGTVALFVLKNEDGSRKYILHRLVRKKGGKLIFCGDHRSSCDPPVGAEDVIGVVSGYRSRGKECSIDSILYRLYSFWMVHTVRCRGLALKLENAAYRVWKKLHG